MTVLLSEMTWPEIKELISPHAVAVLPVASTEQHGPHLPLETDLRIVTDCAVQAAERVAGQIPIAVAPTLPFGYSPHHMDFPGTITLTMSTYVTVLREMCESLVHHGFRKVLILNGHGGNSEAIQVAVREVSAHHKVVAGAATYWDVAKAALDQAGASAFGMVPGHSSGFETTMMLTLRPDLVRRDRLPDRDLSAPGEGDSRSTLAGMGVLVSPHRSEHPTTGIWGDPKLVHPDLGPIMAEAIVASLAKLFIAFSHTEGY